jgi:aspartyl-tRNA(Asn)/glutamyl-tRNA(Gln) amidotransferase subunit A
VDAQRAAGEKLPKLAGVPVAVKDLVVTEGVPTTAGSKMLEGWVPPYDATIVARLKGAQMPILGKTNMDEFAMGSSTEWSAFGPTRNPWDLERIPGGSGGGSAAAVAAYEAPLAIGTDTGGSIRQPGAVTGTVGVKPTYGSISRYGMIAMASSLDQGGPVARNILDAALLHEVLAGHDPRDSTSLRDNPPDFVAAALEGAKGDLSGVRVGVIKQLSGEGYQDGVIARFNESLKVLESLGAEIVEVDCPHFPYALDTYYLIMPAEASSNLAKFDGVRYGLRVEPAPPVTAERMMSATRGAGFGPEVKRRIILGTYALSAGHVDDFYGAAQRVRTLIQQDFRKAFAQADVLVSPTAPTTAFKFGEKMDNPLAMYLNDIATIPANLSGDPALSLPNGLSDDGLPVGFQIIAPQKRDDRLYRVGAALEAALEKQWGGPILNQAPKL